MTIGLIDSDGGTVLFDDRDVTRLPMYLRATCRYGIPGPDSRLPAVVRSKTTSWPSSRRAR